MTALRTRRAAAARRLIELYAERVELAKDMAHSPAPTGAMAQEVLDKGAELDAACEAFRRRFCPTAGRVTVGLYAVMATSPKGRNTHTVLDLFEEYQPAADGVSA